MGYNVLSGSISNIYDIQASGTFTGSFGGDGTNLENVSQFDLHGVQTTGRIVLFKQVSGKTDLQADTNLFYDTTTDSLTTPVFSASSGVNFSGLTSVSASSEKYLALDANNNVVLTSSGGGGTGTVTIANDANNRITTANGSGGIVGEANLTFDGNFLSLQGGLVLKRRTINTIITASNTDYFIGISASSNIEIALPDASTLSSGQVFVFKDEVGTADNHVITIIASSSQTIDGETSIRLESPYAAINLYSDGTSKYFIF